MPYYRREDAKRFFLVKDCPSFDEVAEPGRCSSLSVRARTRPVFGLIRPFHRVIVITRNTRGSACVGVAAKAAEGTLQPLPAVGR